MRALRSRHRQWLVGSVVLSLSSFVLAAVADFAAPAAATMSSSTEPGALPDSVSAMAAARAGGERVEDESQRDGYTHVYANPDGTWTAETSTQPDSVQDGQGEWHNINTTLVLRDGQIVPKYAAADLALSDGGDKTFATMTEGGKTLDWQWPTVLPAMVTGWGTYVGFYDSHAKRRYSSINGGRGDKIAQHTTNRDGAPWNWGYWTDPNPKHRAKWKARVVHIYDDGLFIY